MSGDKNWKVRFLKGGIIGGGKLPSDFSLGFSPAKIALFEIFDACRVNGPVVTLAIRRPTGFDEAIVQA